MLWAKYFFAGGVRLVGITFFACIIIPTLNGVRVLSLRDFVSPQMAKHLCNGCTLHDINARVIAQLCHQFLTSLFFL